jgi:hypothetical protein
MGTVTVEDGHASADRMHHVLAQLEPRETHDAARHRLIVAGHTAVAHWQYGASRRGAFWNRDDRNIDAGIAPHHGAL